MATVIVPIVAAGIGAIAPLIGELAQDFIQKAEAHFPKGSGPFKMATVLGSVLTWLKGLGGAGQTPEVAPEPAELQTVLEGILGLLKAQGKLPVPGSGAAGLAALGTPQIPVSSDSTLAGLKMAGAILSAISQQAA